MKAEDTVMTHKQRVECSHNPNLELRVRDICQAQAEITWDIAFKAGQKEVVEELEAKMNGSSYWAKNCHQNRVRGCKCCQDCPVIALVITYGGNLN